MSRASSCTVVSRFAHLREPSGKHVSESACGHKTMACFTRYNSFRESDLRSAADKSNTYLTLAYAKAAVQMNKAGSKKAVSA